MKAKSIRDWELERYLLRELSPHRLREIDDMIEDDPDLRRQLADLKRSNDQILHRYPSKHLVSAIQHKLEEKRPNADKKKAGPFPRKWLYAVPLLASALGLIFVVLLNLNMPSHQELQVGGQPATRIKGEEDIDISQPRIIIYRKSGESAEIINNGDSASQGDLLQIAYIPAGMTYGVIFSIDGNGIVTLHHPDHAGGSSDLMQEKKVLLASAYELDDAPRYERFFLVAAMEKIDTSRILELAEQLAESPGSVRTDDLSLPNTFTQFSILVIKENEDES